MFVFLVVDTLVSGGSQPVRDLPLAGLRHRAGSPGTPLEVMEVRSAAGLQSNSQRLEFFSEANVTTPSHSAKHDLVSWTMKTQPSRLFLVWGSCERETDRVLVSSAD